jgi:hypothetical protein
MSATSKRVVVRIQLDLEAKDALDGLCDRRGMTQIAVMSRLVKWLVQQDDFVQTAVLSGLDKETLASLSKRLLQRLSKTGATS